MIVSSAATAPSTARSGHDCADNFTTTQSKISTRHEISVKCNKNLLDLIIK